MMLRNVLYGLAVVAWAPFALGQTPPAQDRDLAFGIMQVQAKEPQALPPTVIVEPRVAPPTPTAPSEPPPTPTPAPPSINVDNSRSAGVSNALGSAPSASQGS